jgi:hypothetical protein
MPLYAFGVAVSSYLGHLLSIWPLPFSFTVLVQFSTTLIFLSEVGFYIYFKSHMRNMQWYSRIPSKGEHKSPEGRMRILNNVLEVLSDPSGKCDHAKAVAFIQGWFLGTPLKRILRGNAYQWICWSLFYKYPVNLTADEKEDMDKLLLHFETETGLKFEPGFDRNVRCMRLSLDKITANYQPLMIYMASALLNSVGMVILRMQGFTRHRIGGISFWWRGGQHRGCLRERRRVRQTMAGEVVDTTDEAGYSEDDAQYRVPIVFLHGLGFGLVPSNYSIA